MPIKARIDMLSTGIRTPVGVEVIGKDLVEMEKIAREVEKRSRRFMEPPAPTPNRDRLARHGLMVSEVQDVIATALGAEPITTTEQAGNAIRSPSAIRATCATTRNPLLSGA
jgi:Cu(I)/Ag(I) efflux system membrane protein CusA/SilA